MTGLQPRDPCCSARMALGAVSTLPACDYEDPAHPDLADRFLRVMSAWNDRVQEAVVQPAHPGAHFPPGPDHLPPRFNAFYDIVACARGGPRDAGALELGGQIQDKTPWTLAALGALPQDAADHPADLRRGLARDRRVGAACRSVTSCAASARILKCRYVSFKCADGYYLQYRHGHPLCTSRRILAFKFLGEPLTPPFGAPVRLRIPTKLGFKNPKSLVQPGGDQRLSRRLLGKPGLQLVQRRLERARKSRSFGKKRRKKLLLLGHGLCR